MANVTNKHIVKQTNKQKKNFTLFNATLRNRQKLNSKPRNTAINIVKKVGPIKNTVELTAKVSVLFISIWCNISMECSALIFKGQLVPEMVGSDYPLTQHIPEEEIFC